ncbi:MAG: tRNA pseudouridine(38-40) synthase TruA, partial [Pseudomonadota bacterium]
KIMTNYRLTLEYNGTNYCGWQLQQSTMSVQERLEQALHQLFGQAITTTAAGRTDAGVHALGQVVSFTANKIYPPERVKAAINSLIKPDSIRVLNCQHVAADFSARFSAIKRYYRYHIINNQDLSVFKRNLVWHYPNKTLDVTAMQQGANYLLGHHNFTSFRAAECQARRVEISIDSIDIKRQQDEITIDVSARSFLHHMVRNIVGSLINVGNGNWPPQKIQTILAAQDRTQAGVTAPACGLYFVQVDY